MLSDYALQLSRSFSPYPWGTSFEINPFGDGNGSPVCFRQRFLKRYIFIFGWIDCRLMSLLRLMACLGYLLPVSGGRVQQCIRRSSGKIRDSALITVVLW